MGGSAIDPTSVRPAIADARIERVDPANLRVRLQTLKAEGFTMLLDLGAVDYLQREPRFDVVYHLLKMPSEISSVAQVGQPERLRLLCGVPLSSLSLPTATDLWKSADWAEREIWDLFGIAFTGHPDLRRIQMPSHWEGHPLRKDYPLRGPAREQSPRPEFALKSNVVSGTPPAGRTAEALQKEIAMLRRDAHETSASAHDTPAAQDPRR